MPASVNMPQTRQLVFEEVPPPPHTHATTPGNPAYFDTDSVMEDIIYGGNNYVHQDDETQAEDEAEANVGTRLKPTTSLSTTSHCSRMSSFDSPPT